MYFAPAEFQGTAKNQPDLRQCECQRGSEDRDADNGSVQLVCKWQKRNQ